MKKLIASLLFIATVALGVAPGIAQGPPIRRTGFANYPAEAGAGWHESGILGTYLQSISKTAETVTVAGQDSTSNPVTFTLDREIFVASPTTGLIDVTAEMFESGRVTYWNGEVYGARRNVEHEASGLNVVWSVYAGTDFDGTVDSLNDLPSCSAARVDHYQFVRDQIQGFRRCYQVGFNTYLWQPHSPTSDNSGNQDGRWLGRFANEAQADSHATGLNDIAYWHDTTAGVPRIVTTFQLPATAAYSYYWDSLVDVAGWALSGENSLLPIGKLVFGTPTDGQTIVWDNTDSRLEWVTSSIVSPGTNAEHIPRWSPSQSQYVPGTLGDLLGGLTWAYDTTDDFITAGGDPVLAANVVGLAALDGGVQAAIDAISLTSGGDGWSAVYALFSDGNRRVLQLVAWINGAGTPPAGVGQYVGSSGLVTAAADAIDIRGPAGSAGLAGAAGATGAAGNGGYSPVLEVIADSARRVLRLSAWIGGTGPTPAGVGQYIGSSGLTGTIADAIDIRGASGTAGVGAVDQDDIDASVTAHNTSNTAHEDIRDTSFLGTWSPSVNYERGATVVYDDELWRAHGNPPSGEGEPRHYIGSPWHKISNSIRWRGSDTISSYKVGDIEHVADNLYLFVGGTDSVATTSPPATGWLNLTVGEAITHETVANFRSPTGKSINRLYGDGANVNYRLGYLRNGVTNEVRMRAGQYAGTDNVGFHTGTEVFGHTYGAAGSMTPSVPGGLSGLYSTDTRLSLVVDAANLLWFSGGSIANTVTLTYRSAGETATTTRNLSQFVDAGGYREFWATVTEKAFAVGARYDARFRLGGTVTDVVVSVGPHIIDISDEDSADMLRGEFHAEIERSKPASWALFGNLDLIPSSKFSALGGASSFDDLTGTINDLQIPDNRITNRMLNFSTIATDKLDLETRNALAQQGDITGVAAGTGLAGGGDSGSVSIRLAVDGVSSQYIADGTIQFADLNAFTQQTINNKLSTVAHDATLAGAGTAGNQLSLAAEAVQTAYLRDGAVTPAKASQSLLDMISQDGQPGWSSEFTLPYTNPVSGDDPQFRWGGVAFPWLAFQNLNENDDNLVRSILSGTVVELNNRRFTVSSFTVSGEDLRLNGTFGPPVPNFSQGTNYRIRFSQARVGSEGPMGLQGVEGPQGEVSTVVGEGDGMVRTSIHGRAQVPDNLTANNWYQIPGQTEATWDSYDWIEFYFHRSDNQWSGRIRVDGDARTRMGTVDVTTDVSAAGGSRPSFVALSGNVLVFTTSHLPANTNIYFGSPTAELSSGYLTIWGLTEGALTASSHQLTEAEVTDGTSTQFGLISGQRVRQGANVAINQRIIRVEHTPPEATAANESALIIVGSTGDGYLQRQETIHGTAAQATWENYPITPTGYIGAFGNAPSTIPANGRYYNYGLRIWFQAVLYAGSYRWVSGGEPIGWRGYAPSENVAAANNVDAVDDLVYIANLYSIRRVLTFTPGTNSTVQRTWENQREDEFQGTASVSSVFYEPGDTAVVTTNNNPRAYICLVAGEYTAADITISDSWLRVSPNIRTPVLTDDVPPDNVKEFTVSPYSQWFDTGFNFDVAAQAAITIEVSVQACNVEFNRSFHPDQFELLRDVVAGVMDNVGHGVLTNAISWAGSAPNSTQGTDCRVWVGKDVSDNIMMALRPSVVSGQNNQNMMALRMWRIE